MFDFNYIYTISMTRSRNYTFVRLEGNTKNDDMPSVMKYTGMMMLVYIRPSNFYLIKQLVVLNILK